VASSAGANDHAEANLDYFGTNDGLLMHDVSASDVSDSSDSEQDPADARAEVCKLSNVRKSSIYLSHYARLAGFSELLLMECPHSEMVDVCSTGSGRCSVEASSRPDIVHHVTGAGEHGSEATESGLARGTFSMVWHFSEFGLARISEILTSPSNRSLMCSMQGMCNSF